ncbi:MAG: hybrid sensor histidine kinase/response regulator, partial [Chromatiaceae bacterium]
MAETVVDGLKWVKGEIAVALRRVRDLVETYGASGDPAGLKSAVDSLLEVRGVLLALQLNHPARLAEEMQRLADAMANGSARSPKASAEAMMLALIQLPDHLDRLDAGVALPPLSLWSAINGLRECRGVPPLSQAELLVPESVLAEDSAEVPSPGALDALASDVRKVRPLFHRHLVEWYRPNTAAEGLARLAALFQQFHRYLIDNVLSDLFRLAEAYTDALQVGQVADGHAARTLIGHLDRVLKPLVQDPPAWPKTEATALIDEFLTALEGAGMAAPLVAELQARYRQTTADLVPPDEPNEALAGLAQAVLVELESVKDQLDRFVHGDQGNRPPLEEIRATLGSLAQTLDVTRAGRLPARLRGLAD